MKIALYARVSTSNQDLRNQLKELEDYCRRMDYEVYQTYTDTIGGETEEKNRKGLSECMKDASRRKFDLLLFWSLDRLTREGVYKTITYLRQLESYGVSYKSYTEAYLDSTGIFKEAIIGILASLAKQERVRISERTKAGLEKARQNGKILGRPKLSGDTIKEINLLKSQGLSNRKIGERIGISHATVGAYLGM